MSVHPDPVLEKYVDSLITIIGKAQEPDGYLYTARTIDPSHPHPWAGAKRWVNVSKLSHELFCSGHLFEAASASYLATGKRNFLNIALKNADLLCRVFGPGKRDDAPGHENVEMGLVSLYRITGEKKYLNLAKFFIDCRGKKIDPARNYWQDQKPVIDQDSAVGHAVRATYLYSGMADVAALTHDEDYVYALSRIWNDVVYRKLYITGGIGSTGGNEGFAGAYILPNMSAYCETCASVGNIFWNYRMFLLKGKEKYIDVLERTLYNALSSGVSLTGNRFFYSNPLASFGQYKRKPWFICACCPTNLCRLIPTVPGYIYAKNTNSIYVNLYIQNNADIRLQNNNIGLKMHTDYPWDGAVRLEINPQNKGRFGLYLRIPGWARNEPVPGDLYRFMHSINQFPDISVNGKRIITNVKNGYVIINRKWRKGDRVTINFPMPVRKVLANEKVKADKDCFALQRGPLVYCLEGPDQKGGKVLNLMADPEADFTSEYVDSLLGGVQVIRTSGKSYARNLDGALSTTRVSVTAIPYYVWANRYPSEMTVWIPRKAKRVRPLPAPTIAFRSKVVHKNNSAGAIYEVRTIKK